MIVGTFAAISPSFMIGAHAQQYGMDKGTITMNQTMEKTTDYDDKKSYGKEQQLR